MGCVHSRLEKEETVWRSRERKRLMKQLLICRSELANAHMAYLHSLRNTGATLRQFTGEESLFSGNSSPLVSLPPLPPPPPPPPPPEERNVNGDDDSSNDVETDEDDNESCMPPPRSIHSLDWDFWDPFGVPSDSDSNSDSPVVLKKDEEKWAETNTEFEDEEEEVECEGSGVDMALVKEKEKDKEKEKSPSKELIDDKSSRETDGSVAVWRSKKTLAGVVKEIDDYFLKAAAGGGDLLILLDSTHCQRLEGNFKKTKGEFYSTLVALIA